MWDIFKSEEEKRKRREKIGYYKWYVNDKTWRYDDNYIEPYTKISLENYKLDIDHRKFINKVTKTTYSI